MRFIPIFRLVSIAHSTVKIYPKYSINFKRLFVDETFSITKQAHDNQLYTQHYLSIEHGLRDTQEYVDYYQNQMVSGITCSDDIQSDLCQINRGIIKLIDGKFIIINMMGEYIGDLSESIMYGKLIIIEQHCLQIIDQPEEGK